MVDNEHEPQRELTYDPSSPETNTQALRTQRRASFQAGMAAITSGKPPTKKVVPGGTSKLQASFSQNRVNVGRRPR